MVAYCGRCKRRKVVEYEIAEEVKLLRYRWKTGVCLPCVDELAEKAAFATAPRIWRPQTWSDLAPERQGAGREGDDGKRRKS